MKKLIILIFVTVSMKCIGQDLKAIKEMSFDATIKYIDFLANQNIALPLVEVYMGGQASDVDCNYEFDISKNGLLMVERKCNNENMYENYLSWKAYLKQLELTDLNCKEYEVGKSLNYVFLRCKNSSEYCIIKNNERNTKLETKGLPIYLKTEESAEKLQAAFERLLELSSQNPAFLKEEPK